MDCLQAAQNVKTVDEQTQALLNFVSKPFVMENLYEMMAGSR
jgi:hypothetical protein